MKIVKGNIASVKMFFIVVLLILCYIPSILPRDVKAVISLNTFTFPLQEEEGRFMKNESAFMTTTNNVYML